MNTLTADLVRLSLAAAAPAPATRLKILLAPACAHCGWPVLDTNPEALEQHLPVLCAKCHEAQVRARDMLTPA